MNSEEVKVGKVFIDQSKVVWKVRHVKHGIARIHASHPHTGKEITQYVEFNVLHRDFDRPKEGSEAAQTEEVAPKKPFIERYVSGEWSAEQRAKAEAKVA